MNINASIIDQQITGLIENSPEGFPAGGDLDKKKSSAFVLLCASACLDRSVEEVSELLTDGGNDAGVDALHIGEVEDGEFLVTIFQGKYKVKDLTGEATFPENGIEKAVHTVQILFDPYRNVTLNEKIAPKVEQPDLSHRNFKSLLDSFNTKRAEYYRDAIRTTQGALTTCYGHRHISLQQLSSTFRRGDLLEMLEAQVRAD